MSTSPTGAGLLYVGYVGSREALGQVPGQQLARSSVHASIKNKSKLEILLHTQKRSVCWGPTTLFFALSLDFSAYDPPTKWPFKAITANCEKPHSDVAVNSTVDANHTGTLKLILASSSPLLCLIAASRADIVTNLVLNEGKPEHFCRDTFYCWVEDSQHRWCLFCRDELCLSWTGKWIREGCRGFQIQFGWWMCEARAHGNVL